MLFSFTNQFQNLLQRTSNHLFLRPHPLLRPYIAHYTVSLPARNEVPGVLTLVPDASGCFVFTLTPRGLSDRVYGATTRTVTVQNDVNEVPMRLFVEFSPGGLTAFVGGSLWELTDRTLSLREVHPALYWAVLTLPETSRDLDDLIQRLDRLLLAHLLQREAPAFFSEGLSLLVQSGGKLSMKELSQKLHYSERHISRSFQDCLGMSAGRFSRLLRINHAIRRMEAPVESLTLLAQEAGFYDQPHFIHAFEEVCGLPPTAYLKKMSAFYKEPYKL